MQVTETHYYCDICGKEVSDKEMNTLRVPVVCSYDNNAESFVQKADVEVCNDCLQKMAVLHRQVSDDKKNSYSIQYPV